jgi:hypothetical protein
MNELECIPAEPGFRGEQISVCRYGSRHWGVYLNGELLAVTVYKKGARAIETALASRSDPRQGKQ